MKHFVELANLRKQRVYLPDFIASRMIQGTKFHGIILPNEWQSKQDLFLSMFPFESWTDLWKIDIYLKDRRGLVKELCDRLRDLQINILGQDLSIESDEDGTPTGVIQMICDMSRYVWDGTQQERQSNPDARLTNLTDYLVIEFWESLRWNKHQPQLYSSRLRELCSIGRRATRRVGMPGASNQFVSKLEEGVVKIENEKDWQDLTSNGVAPDGKGLFPVTITYDTVERYIRVSALNTENDYFTLEVPHKDEKGQIAKFTSLISELRKPCQLSIICGYLRLKEANASASWRCLLQCDRGKKDTMMQLLATEFAKERIAVEYPKPVQEPPRKGFWSRISRLVAS